MKVSIVNAPALGGQQAAPWSLSSRQTGLRADPVQGSSPALCTCGKRTGVQDGAGCRVAELRPVSTRGHGAVPHEGSRVHQLIETHVRVCMFPRGGNIWKATHQTVNGVLMGDVKGLGWAGGKLRGLYHFLYPPVTCRSFAPAGTWSTIIKIKKKLAGLSRSKT